MFYWDAEMFLKAAGAPLLQLPSDCHYSHSVECGLQQAPSLCSLQVSADADRTCRKV